MNDDVLISTASLNDTGSNDDTCPVFNIDRCATNQGAGLYLALAVTGYVRAIDCGTVQVENAFHIQLE